MNKLYKGLVISMAVLALAGCSPQEQADQGADTGAQTEVTENQVLTIENITDEKLAEMTGFDAEFRAYLENGPTQIMFLKDDGGEMKSTGSISIFSGGGEDSTALYVYEEAGTVTGAKLDEFVGSISTEGMDYDFMFYRFANMMEKQPTEAALGYTSDSRESFETDMRKAYIGQPLYTLHEKLGVYVPVYRYEKSDSAVKLNTYTIVSEIGYTASTDVNVIYDEEGTILNLYLDDTYGPGKQDPLNMLDQE